VAIDDRDPPEVARPQQVSAWGLILNNPHRKRWGFSLGDCVNRSAWNKSVDILLFARHSCEGRNPVPLLHIILWAVGCGFA
jgi:hypothetical protein